MAEDNRYRDDRTGRPDQRDPQGPLDQSYGQAHGQPPYAQPSYGQARPGQPGAGQGRFSGDQSQNQYGQAGGYSQPTAGGPPRGPDQYGQDYWQGQTGPSPSHSPSQSYGQGGYGQPAFRPEGGANPEHRGTGFSAGGQAYTGQTGTGYGHTPGGQQGGFQPTSQAGEPQGLWDRTKSFFTGDHASNTPGPHRGRGPKGYSRSDERIRDDVNDRLTDDPFLDATHIEVIADAGEVTLTGTVSSRADKRRAEDLADNVSGVKHVQNNLRVETAAQAGDDSGRNSPVQPIEDNQPR